jgi:hypothetical protein
MIEWREEIFKKISVSDKIKGRWELYSDTTEDGGQHPHLEESEFAAEN